MSTTRVVCAKKVGLFKIHMQLCNLLSKHFLMVRDVPLNNSPVDERLCCFQVTMMTQDTAMNSFVHKAASVLKIIF